MDSETLRRAEAVAREIMALRAEVERLTESERSLQAQVELGEAYESRLLAEVERLRGIVQADLEEKAEAWGEVERLRAAYAEARDMVLNDRGPLAEAQMDTAQTNAVLATIDALWPTLFSDGLPANKEGSRDA